MELTFYYNNKHFMGFTAESAKEAGVPDNVIEQAFLDSQWEIVRNRRDYLVSKTDFTQMPDSPLTAEQKQAFADYRQALRDLPQQFDNPDDVVWPQKPEL